MQKITTFLWFDDKAEEAATFYTSIFARSRITNVARYGAGAPRPEGSVMTVSFELEGQEFIALNGGPHYHFTPAISLFVNCETQAEVDAYWEKLGAGGKPIQCGWIEDRYGLCWQIVPRQLLEMLQDSDRARANRTMQAMLEMVKLDLAELRRAYDGV
ncbi:MAG TPA: VOC family protein [Stellaceae bacterium]|nr:VOC family protein [Stellaceae bacterium]